MFSLNNSTDSRPTRSPGPLRKVKAFSNLTSQTIEPPDSLLLLTVAPNSATLVTEHRTQRKLQKCREGQSIQSTEETSSSSAGLASATLVRSKHRHTTMIDNILVSPCLSGTFQDQTCPCRLPMASRRAEKTKLRWNFGQIPKMFPSRARNSHPNLRRFQISQPANPIYVTGESSHNLARSRAYQAPPLHSPNQCQAVSGDLLDSSSARICAALSSHPIVTSVADAPSRGLVPHIILTSPSQAMIFIDSAPAWRRAGRRKDLHPLDEALKLQEEKSRARSRQFSEQRQLLSSTITRLEREAEHLIDDATRQKYLADTVSTLYTDLKLAYRHLFDAHKDLQGEFQKLGREFRLLRENCSDLETDLFSNTDKEALPIELPIEAQQRSTSIVDPQIYELSASSSSEALRPTLLDVFASLPEVSVASASTFDCSLTTVEVPELQSIGDSMPVSGSQQQARNDDEFNLIDIKKPATIFRFGSRRVQSVPAVQRVRISQYEVDGGHHDNAFFLRLTSWEWISIPKLDIFDPRDDGGV